MLLQVANFFECDRISAKAAAGLTNGFIVKVSDNGSGERLLSPMLDADTPVMGKYAIVMKVSVDPFEVESTTATADTGIRTLSISAGDDVVELRRGSKVEYTLDLLHASLDPARAGAVPVAGQQLEIKGSQWCLVGTSGATGTAPKLGEVLRVFGSGATAKVVIELL